MKNLRMIAAGMVTVSSLGLATPGYAQDERICLDGSVADGTCMWVADKASFLKDWYGNNGHNGNGGNSGNNENGGSSGNNGNSGNGGNSGKRQFRQQWERRQRR